MLKIMKRKERDLEVPDICSEHKRISLKLSRIEGENIAIITMLAVVLVIVLEKLI